MIVRFSFICLFWLTGWLPVLSAQSELPPESELPSVLELYRNYIEANGGRANIQSVQTIMIKGRVELPSDDQGYSFTVFRKRPDMMRLISRYREYTVESVWDGERGVQQIDSSKGPTETVEIKGAAKERMASDSKMDGPFFQLEGRSDYLEVEAFEEVDGHPCVRLRVLPAADFEYDYIWLSLEHYQEVRLSAEQKAPDSGDTLDKAIVFDRFNQASGVWFAHRARYYADGKLSQTVLINKVKVNVGIYDSYFRID